jgi:hypothetical protein
MHAKYSGKQISDYRQSLLANPGNAKAPKCRQCVGGPAEELTCHRCDLTKAFDAFSKVQRRSPDTAVGCVGLQIETY